MERVGGYEVEEEIGRGALGAVFRARDAAGKQVAVKLLSQADSLERRARFSREIRLQACLGEAQGFVPLLDAGVTAQGIPFVVMPYLTGGTLRERLRRGPLPPHEAAELAESLAEALAACHALGIVHRDVKPDNVLFGAHGRPLLADLGLAKHFDRTHPSAAGSVDLSRAGEMRGTIGYTPPEQLRDARGATPTADVFAWGATVYEALAGHAPFVAPNATELLYAVESGRFEPLRSACPTASPALAALVEAALAREPGARPRDGAALLLVLRGEARRRGGRARSIAAVVGLGALALAGWLLAPRGGAPGMAHTGPAPLDSAARARELLRTAEGQLARGDAGAASQALDQVLVLAPGLAGAWAARAEARAEAGDWSGALEDAAQALGRPEAEAGARHRALAARGLALLRQGRPDEACCDLLAALEEPPGTLRAWLRRAQARAALGDREGARADAERFLALAASDPAAGEARALLASSTTAPAPPALPEEAGSARRFAAQAQAKLDAGDLEGARADARLALELSPDLGLAWHIVGAVQLRQGEAAAALESCSRALQMDPGLAVAHAVRGQAAILLGRLEEGVTDLGQALALDPSRVEAWLARADAHAQAGREARAVCDLTRALELEPERAAAWLLRGRLRGARGDLEGAARDAERCLELAPDAALEEAARAHLAALRGAPR